MKAIIYDTALKPKLKEINDYKKIPKKHSLIKVKSCGLCGSDMHRLTCKKDPKRYMKNFILGHELSGFVIKSDKKELINKRIAIKPLVICNKCENCKKKSEKLCSNLKSIGKELRGGFAEYVIVPNENIKIINDNISYDEAALLDTLAVGVHIFQLIKKAIKYKPKKILIIGDGAVGLCSHLIAKAFGIKTEIIGKNNLNLNIAKKIGSKPIKLNNLSKIKKDSYDAIIETVGRNQTETLNLAIEFCKANGVIIIAGVYPEGYLNKINLRTLCYKQITLRGANSYSYWNKKDEYDIALDLLYKKKLNVKELITHKLPLEKFSQGIEIMKNKKLTGAIKVIFNP